jgi:hypothetical protein
LYLEQEYAQILVVATKRHFPKEVAMKGRGAFAFVASAAALALPAATAAPPTRTDGLSDEVATLRAEVKRLTAANRRLKAANRRLTAATSRLTADNKLISERWNESLRRQLKVQRHVAAVDPCPITRPNENVPPGSTFGAEFHGNGALWVGLWSSNVVVWQLEPDGSIAAKFGWWREEQGRLRIEGRRLDAAAPPLTAHIPDGYGDAGFQATRIKFPTEGCWEVTGSVGNASLTFVTRVLGA